MNENEMETTAKDNEELCRLDNEYGDGVWHIHTLLPAFFHRDCLRYIAITYLEGGLIDPADLSRFDPDQETQTVNALANLGLIERGGHGVVPTARGLHWAAWDAEATARKMRALADQAKVGEHRAE